MARDMIRVPTPPASGQYQAPQMRLGRSVFTGLSHRHKTSFNVGELVPYCVLEVVPGDTFTIELNAFARIFSPLGAPVMDDIHLDIDFWYVPNRIVWSNWKYFLGEHDQAGAQDVTYQVPILASGQTIDDGFGAERLARYMGIPWGLQTGSVDVQTLPFRCYALIHREHYRDQNVISEDTVPMGDGPDSLGTFLMQKSAKKPDYFTTALPYLQKGTAQSIPLTDVDIYTDVGAGSQPAVYSTAVPGYRLLDANAATVDISTSTSSAASALYAPLSTLEISINALRESAAIQRMLERDARGGTRHPEKIRAHFGVDVPDYRVQRPEYLGGGKGYINISPVANTSSTATEDQGELAGIGTGQLRCKVYKSFVEFGHIIGILRARGEVTYQQGLERMWSRRDLYDFLWPELANLGEQPIYRRELFIQNGAGDDEVFGYQERYADYRFKKSLATGLFASDATGSLDFWHLAEDFASAPLLNQTFIEDQTPMSRITVQDSEDDFLIDGYFNVRVARALPVRPTPSLMPARY